MTLTLDVPLKDMLMEAAHGAVTEVVKNRLPSEHDGKGGYFRFAVLVQTREGNVINQIQHGWVGGDTNRDMVIRYAANSAEKLLRLAEHQPEHLSAFQSHTDGLNFPGALAVDVHMPAYGQIRTIASLSGLPWQADEASMAQTYQNLNRMDGWEVPIGRIQLALSPSQNRLLRI